MPPPDNDDLEPGVAAAFQAAINDDWPTACDQLKTLTPTGMFQGVMAWIDTALYATGYTDYDGDEPVRLLWLNNNTGDVFADADRVDAATRWAGRMFAARLADDEDNYMALWDAIPKDPLQAGAHIIAILQGAAIMVRRGKSHRT